MQAWSPAHQHRGVVILGVLMLLILAAISIFAATPITVNAELERNKRSVTALAIAREALVAYAVSNVTPGRFPCPEDTSPGIAEGTAKTNCSNSSIEIGRLPWRSLKIGKVVDGHGEPLWYALSPGFRDPPINSDSVGKIKVDGADNAAVALVISAGPPLPGQNRSSPTILAANYLDGLNAIGSEFVTQSAANEFNDRVLAISRDQLMKLLERRVAAEARNALNSYFAINHFYPYPADFSDPTCLCVPVSPSDGTCKPQVSDCNSVAATCTASACRGRIPITPSIGWGTSLLRGGPAVADWFHKNGWRELIYYAVAPSCVDGTVNCSGTTGFLQLDSGTTNRRTIVIATGRTLSHQSRLSLGQKNILNNYLEELNLSASDYRFISRSQSGNPAFNDIPVTSP